MNNRRKDGHSFTVSRLQALRLCPYRYHLQYELNIRVGGAASRQGIAVHAAVAGFLRRWEETDMAITTGKKARRSSGTRAAVKRQQRKGKVTYEKNSNKR